MKLLVKLLSILVIIPALAFAQSFPHGEKKDFANGSERGEVSIESDNRTLRRGELYDIKYTFHVLNSSYAVYNWQFIRLIPLPGQLAIYDANRVYIGDLIAWAGGSRSGVTDECWTFLYGETYLGKRLGFTAGFVPGTEYDSQRNQLPAGIYYVQLILYRAFIAPNPFRTLGEKIDFYRTFDKSELCRSNIIKIELINN